MQEENNNFDNNPQNTENSDNNEAQNNIEQNASVEKIDSAVENKSSETKSKNLLKYILIIISVFLIIFGVVYAIVDYNMYKLGLAPFETTFRQMEKMLNQEAFFEESPSAAPVIIKSKKDKYIITVDLKQFDNDAENINIETKDNEIKISGSIYKTYQGKTESNSFYQNVIFPAKINTEKIKKEQAENKLIITIPFSK